MFPESARVLELCGGEHPLNPKKWLNADVRWLPQADMIIDLNYPLPIEPNSFDGIYCRFGVEHVSWRKVRGLINETHRILKPGGKAVFITANLLAQALKLTKNTDWNDDLICMIFGDNDYPENTHRCGFSPQYAIKLFKEAGYYSVTAEPLPECNTDMTITAYKSKAKLT